jgi:hypothetical protein
MFVLVTSNLLVTISLTGQDGSSNSHPYQFASWNPLKIRHDKMAREGKDLLRDDQEDFDRRHQKHKVFAENVGSNRDQPGFCFQYLSSHSEFLGNVLGKAVVDPRIDPYSGGTDQFSGGLHVGNYGQYALDAMAILLIARACDRVLFNLARV